MYKSQHLPAVQNRNVMSHIETQIQLQIASGVIDLLVSKYQTGINDESIIDVSNCELAKVYQFAEKLFDGNGLHLSSMATRLLESLTISIDMDKALTQFDEVEGTVNNLTVANQLVENGASFPLMHSLFGMTEKEFSHIRKRASLINEGFKNSNLGGRPRLLSEGQIDQVRDSWNYFIAKLYKSGRYSVGHENYLIGDTILSVFRDTKVMIKDFWPLIDKEISKILATINVTQDILPLLELSMGEKAIYLAPVCKKVKANA